MPRKVKLSPHDPNWACLYQEEAGKLADFLSHEIIAIHHMGSTAIPGIFAKPIIDILVVVTSIDRIDGYNDQMVTNTQKLNLISFGVSMKKSNRSENSIPAKQAL